MSYLVSIIVLYEEYFIHRTTVLNNETNTQQQIQIYIYAFAYPNKKLYLGEALSSIIKSKGNAFYELKCCFGFNLIPHINPNDYLSIFLQIKK
jgi:hypothetical protein